MPTSQTHIKWIAERLCKEGFEVHITSEIVYDVDYLSVVSGDLEISRFIPKDLTRRERVFLFWEMSNTIRMKERKWETTQRKNGQKTK